MKKSLIATNDAPKAIGAYSQAVRVTSSQLVFVSGQLGMDPLTMELLPGGVEAEARQALTNLGAILKKAGGGFESVVKATVFLVDINDFAAVNEIYASFFKDIPPARAAVAVAALPKGARVEIEAIAAL